jgi:hypothetical protein
LGIRKHCIIGNGGTENVAEILILDEEGEGLQKMLYALQILSAVPTGRVK